MPTAPPPSRDVATGNARLLGTLQKRDHRGADRRPARRYRVYWLSLLFRSTRGVGVRFVGEREDARRSINR